MGLIRHGIAFSFGTFLSRILGYLRDAVIAYQFGVSSVTDAFFIAFRLPNTFRRLLGEGGFNAAFVPLYAKSLKEGRERSFLSSVFTFYIAVNLAITLLGILLADKIVALIAPGIREKAHFPLAVFFARWLFVYLFFVGVSALFMALLNVRGKFFVPAFAQGVFNLVFSLVVALLGQVYGYLSLIGGALLGGFFQMFFHLPFVRGVSFGISFSIDPEVKTLVKRLMPALLGVGVAQLSFFIDTFLASFLALGAVSYLYYANRIFQLPLGVFSAGMANSLLSVLSTEGQYKRDTTLALRFVLLVSIPATVGLFILSEQIVELLYGRGRFTQEDVDIAGKVLQAYSIGLVFFSLQKTISAVFFAKGDTKTPVKASFVSVLSEALFAYLYAFVLGMGVFGLALGTSTSALIGFSYLLHKTTVVEIGKILSMSYKGLVSSLLMGIVIYALGELNPHPLSLLYLIPLGMLFYFSLLLVMREELALLSFSKLKSLVHKQGKP